jgi:nuclear pore complex protein Nup205
VDLNSLFVYESKMSLLVRIAQTRQGATRLLEHRVFETLSRCTFISAKPELDQMSQIGKSLYGSNIIF